MKEQIWYSAYHDSILVKVSRGKVSLGCQVSNHGVPDYLELFLYKIYKDKWELHIALGWLVRLE